MVVVLCRSYARSIGRIVEGIVRGGHTMRKLIVSTYTTLDGVMNPVNWGELRSDEEDTRFSRDLLFGSDLLLMGRATYEFFSQFWPSLSEAGGGSGGDEIADKMNSIPKAVASTTLKGPLTWNATLIEGDVTEGVAALKRQEGQNILMYGAGDLARTLMQHGLVDELQVLVHPVVWGSGEYIFKNASDLPALKLVDTRAFRSSIVMLTYQPSPST
jgi:dihydrofolate reductase